jgi:hypothetical protein
MTAKIPRDPAELLPRECTVDPCFSRIFTRTVSGTYVDEETLYEGVVTMREVVSEPDYLPPWKCQAGHSQTWPKDGS